MTTTEGLVLRARGGIYHVETPDGVVDATLRGRLKQQQRIGGVIIGDRVRLASVGDGEGEGAAWTIEEVAERDSLLVRRAPGKAPRPKPIVANVGQIVVVFALTRPAPHLRMLDRFLVLCESTGIPPLIIVNKVDLGSVEEAEAMFGLYREIGYPVLFTSAESGDGIADLNGAVCERISAFTGPSGVGKSSLLNALQPGLALRVASISEAVHKGRHTTVNAQLIPLDCGGYVADTPGLRELGLWGIPRDELDGCFPEFRPLIGHCRYARSCTHTHEPQCAIQEAAEQGDIPPSRYDSYVRMLAEDESLQPQSYS